MSFSYTITRENGFYTYADSNNAEIVVSAEQLDMQYFGVGDNFIFENFSLDFTQCTEPAGATTPNELIDLIRNLTD